MMGMAYRKQAQIQAERAQRAADRKTGVGPVEKAHIAQTQAVSYTHLTLPTKA